MVKAVTSDANLDDLSNFVVSGHAGDFVFQEGDTGEDMYIVQEGQIELSRQYAGEARTLARLEVGDFFGEMSLLEAHPREVSARAVTEYRLLRIDHSTLSRIVREDPEIAVRMLHRLSSRLREYQEADARAAEIAQGGMRIPEAVAPPAPAAPAPAAPAAPAAQAPRTAVLTAAGGVEFPLANRSEFTVGRIDRAAGFTPDVDLTALDTQRTLSRRHARIVERDGAFYVREEKDVRNGTFVNGVRVASGAEVKLTNGAQVRFGLVEMVFHQ